MTRVLLVVHNRILRTGICRFLELQDEVSLAAVVSTPEAAVLVFTELQPDLTLLDLDLPDEGGLDAIHRIRQMDRAAWIIALIMDEADERSAQAIALGATRVIAKDRIGKISWQNLQDLKITPLQTPPSRSY